MRPPDIERPLVLTRRLTQVLSLAAASALVLSLFASAPSTGGILESPWDKLVHFGFFAFVTLLLAIGFGGRARLAFIAAVLTGVADESYQAFLPTRHASWGDLVTDVVAAACAALLAHHLLGVATPEATEPGNHRSEPDQRPRAGD